MPFNKSSAIFFSSCNSFSGRQCSSSVSITSSSLSSRPLHASSSPLSSSPISYTLIPSSHVDSWHHSRRRSYATVNHHHRRGHNDLPEWPNHPHPTPYDILAMRRADPYTKHRFYQLVKVYHPDRHGHAAEIHHLSKAARLERYRLIVAANDLLSDPSKRRLYDTHGVGWTGDRPPTLNESVRYAEHAWRDQPGNASRNATWEDWERWYDARDGKPADSMYMSNGIFATLVVMMCMIGAFAQMSRAESSGVEYMEMGNQRNMAIGQQMARNTLIAAGRSKDERVDNFLRDRENLTYEFSPSKYENLPSETGSEGEQGRQQPRP